MEWCTKRHCEPCSKAEGITETLITGCPYDDGCKVLITDWHEEGDHRRCGAECDVARVLYPQVRRAGVASATSTRVAVVSCQDGTIRVHGTYPTNKARRARTDIGKSLGIPPEDWPDGGRSFHAIKGVVLIVCSEGHLT